MTEEHTPEELRDVVSALSEGAIDEDREADLMEAAEEDGDEQDGDEYVDADELMQMLAKMQASLDDQSKELRGLRREMRELRDQLGSGGREAPRRDTPPRDDRGERSFRPREDRPQSGGFRPREDRPQGGGFRPREDRGGGSGREFRPREDRPQGGGFRPREDRPQGGGQGSFRPREDRGSSGSREFRPRGDRPQGASGGASSQGGGSQGGEFRPRPRKDHGWGKKRDE